MTIPQTVGRARAVQPVVRTDVEIAVPPERVFDALTDPAELAAWLGAGEANGPAVNGPAVNGTAADGTAANGTATSSDDRRPSPPPTAPRPGDAWAVPATGPGGHAGHVGGEYRVVDSPRRLETSWQPSWDDAPSHVRFDLVPAEVDGVPGTRLTVTHTGPCMGLLLRAPLASLSLALGRPGAPTVARTVGYRVWRGMPVGAPAGVRGGRPHRRTFVIA